MYGNSNICLAAAVAAARIYEDGHWASDVLAGAAAGYGIGRLTLRLNENNRENLYVTPFVRSEGLGLSAQYNF